MKFLKVSIILVFQMQSGMLHAQLREESDYLLGRDVGKCLVAKCQVFRGHLLTDSPQPGTPVTIQVDEWLFGTPSAAETIEVPYSTEILNKDPKGSPGYAWRNVTLARNAPLTVVLALERVAPVEAGHPVRVTSDDRRSGIIRSLAEKARQIRTSPGLISNAVDSLSGEPNEALAGYLYTLAGHVRTTDFKPEVPLNGLEFGCSLDEKMIGNPNVPADTWELIGGRMVLFYHRLSPSARGAVVRRFAELAQQRNPLAGRAAFHGLAKIARFDPSVQSLVHPGTLDGIADSYRGLVKQGSIPRDPALEKGLGIKYQ